MRIICASWSAGEDQSSANHGAEQHSLFEQAHEEAPGFAFVVRSMQIDYLKPARMDDVLDIVTWPIVVKGASITPGAGSPARRGCAGHAEVRVAFYQRRNGRSRFRNRCGC